MESKEILDRIEVILDSKASQADDTKTESAEQTDSKTIKDVLYLALQFILNIFKAPFKIIARYLRDEIITAVKKDAKIYSLILGIMGVLFIFFSVLWLFISVAVGVFFYDEGYSILVSISYSIIFQIVSFILIAMIAFIASRNLSSIKMIKKVKQYK